MSKIIRKIINSPLAAAPVAPYNQAVQVGNTVYLSGVLGLDKGGQLVSGGTLAQARQAFVNMENVLKAANSGFDKVIKITVLMQDLNDFKDFNALYTEFIKEPYPARTAYQVGKLPLGAMIEIEAIAISGDVETVKA